MVKVFYLFLFLTLFLACNQKINLSKDSITQPNILLIVSEDNGPDLGCYGNQYVTTPNLDNLAKKGFLFKNAFVTYSVCSPSRSTIYTGLFPHQNGQIGLATHKFRMVPGIKTMPQYLKEAGYRTGCLGKIHVNPEKDIPFDFHPIKGANFAKKDLPRYALEAGKFINDSDDPFFLMINFPDAHFPVQKQVEGMPAKPLEVNDVHQAIPFTGANSARLREFTANYYNCMNRLDESVGMVLNELEQSGKRENTLIIYLGDHGAQFSRGKCSNYESGLKVPFIVSWPGKVKANTTSNRLISTIDLLPTILEFAGIDIPTALPGKSLKKLLHTSSVDHWAEYVYADGAGSAVQFFFPRRSIRGPRYKLIENLLQDRENPKYAWYAEQKGSHFAAGTMISELETSSIQVQNAYKTWKTGPQYELYDLREDPLEWNNLSEVPTYQEIKVKLIQELRSWQHRTNDPLLKPEKLKQLTQEIGEVYSHYPKLGYRSDPSFQWQYHDYLEMVVPSGLENGDLNQDKVIFKGGEEGFFNYRIPSLLTTQKGTVLAVAEGRNAHSDHAANDLVLKRSKDHGVTWSPLQVIAEDGENNLNNPTLVQLTESGRILLMYQVFPAKYHARAIPSQGVKLVESGWDNPKAQNTFLIFSDDDGGTWSLPRDITKSIKKEKDIVAVATGPGIGIQISQGTFQGRVIMPQNETWYEGSIRKFNVYATYSDDGGVSWKSGEPAPSDPKLAGQEGYGNEVQMVEIQNGWILLNSRSNKGNRLRKTAISKDGGVSWSNLTDEPQLPEPMCMGSTLKFINNGKTYLAYSGPANQFSRSMGKVRISEDFGKSWPRKLDIIANHFAYSCLTQMTNGDLAILYESNNYQTIKFKTLSPEWDDFEGREKMKIEEILVQNPVYPVLRGKEHNPVRMINIRTTGMISPTRVTNLEIELSESKNLDLIESFSLHAKYPRNNSQPEELLGTVSASDMIHFATDINLNQGNNELWLSLKLREKADISLALDFTIKRIIVNGVQQNIADDPKNIPKRLGVALRKHMDNGVHTYRIPGIVTTNEGTLIAVYDIRRNSGVDLQEDVDVGMSRSTDGGHTWEPMRVIMDMGEWGGLPQDQNGIGDPSILVDESNNTIWVAAIWAHGHPEKRNWWASRPGVDPKETSQLVLVNSKDDGVTWSGPINITKEVKNPKWYLLLQGPGKGITMKNGTIVFPAQYKDANQMPHSTILYSLDHGDSWHLGTGAKSNTTESQVVELSDGSLMLNMRDNRGRNPVGTGSRSVSITNDLGKTWEEHASSRKTLPEPVCNAGLIKHHYYQQGKEKSVLIFINPANVSARKDMTIKVSFDEGKTWPEKYHMLLDEGRGRGYPSLTSIDQNTIGILYEGSQADLVFQRISLSDLIRF